MRHLVHLGFPKCGSTTLQKSVFPYVPASTYVGLAGDLNVGRDTEKAKTTSLYNLDLNVKNFYENLIDGDISQENLSELLLQRRYLEEKYSKNGLRLIYSHESLLSSRFSRNPLMEKLVAYRELFYDCDVLICTRPITKVASSLYYDQPYIVIDGRKRLVPYAKFWDWHISQGKHGLLIELCHNFIVDFLSEKLRVTKLELEGGTGAMSEVSRLMNMTTEELGVRLEKTQNLRSTKLNLMYRRAAIYVNGYLKVSNLGWVKKLHYVFLNQFNKVDLGVVSDRQSKIDEKLVMAVGVLEQQLMNEYAKS